MIQKLAGTRMLFAIVALALSCAAFSPAPIAQGGDVRSSMSMEDVHEDRLNTLKEARKRGENTAVVAEALYWASQASSDVGDLDAAVELMEDAVEIERRLSKPIDPYAVYVTRLSRLYEQRGQISKAEQCLFELIDSHLSVSVDWSLGTRFLLADLLLRSGDEKRAVREYREILDAAPRSAVNSMLLEAVAERLASVEKDEEVKAEILERAEKYRALRYP